MVDAERAFIGAYAHRFMGVDENRRLRVDMAELDRLVSELIAQAVAHELRAQAGRHDRDATWCRRVADELTGGES